MKTQNSNIEKFYVARDNDGRLFKFEYKNTMKPRDAPCKYVNAYPFDGNFYVTGSDYQPKKGEELDSSLILKLHMKIHRFLLKNKDQNKNHEGV